MILRFVPLAIGLIVVAGCGGSDTDDDDTTGPTWTVQHADNRPTVTPVAAAVADMDGDGLRDIVSAWRGSAESDTDKTGMIAVHVQTEPGQWQTLIADQGPKYAQVNAFTVGDVNADAHPDIVVAAMDRIVYLKAPLFLRAALAAPGEHRWQVFEIEASIGEPFKAWYDVAVGRIDGHHGPDIAAALADDGRLVWFKAPKDPDTAKDWLLMTIDAATRKQCDSLILADLNGDQELDVISTAPGETENVISWYEHPADIDKDPWPKHPMSDFAGATRIALGDLDADDKPDLAVISPTDRRAAWLIHPAIVAMRWGGFVMADFSQGFDERLPVDVAIADVNADGANDIVIATTSPGVVSWFRPGTDSQLRWKETEIVRLTEVNVGLIGVGDVNADLFVDVAVPQDHVSRDPNDGIYWYRNPYFNQQPVTQPVP